MKYLKAKIHHDLEIKVALINLTKRSLMLTYSYEDKSKGFLGYFKFVSLAYSKKAKMSCNQSSILVKKSEIYLIMNCLIKIISFKK